MLLPPARSANIRARRRAIEEALCKEEFCVARARAQAAAALRECYAAQLSAHAARFLRALMAFAFDAKMLILCAICRAIMQRAYARA